MTPEPSHGNNFRKFMLSLLAFVLLAGLGYMVVTIYLR
jgi:hypothetical protein